ASEKRGSANWLSVACASAINSNRTPRAAASTRRIGASRGENDGSDEAARGGAWEAGVTRVGGKASGRERGDSKHRADRRRCGETCIEKFVTRLGRETEPGRPRVRRRVGPEG